MEQDLLSGKQPLVFPEKKCYNYMRRIKLKQERKNNVKLIFKQRLFSWFDSYDIYDQEGNTVYTVEGQLSWGHLLRIYDAARCEVGTVKEKILTFLPKFEIYLNGQCVGAINKELSFIKPRYNVEYNGWRVQGDFLEWEYSVFDSGDKAIASVSKQIWHLADTYTIDVADPRDALCALMVVLAIDAEKCTRK